MADMFRWQVLAIAFLVTLPADAVQPLGVLHIKVVVVDSEQQATPVPRHALLISENPASAPPRRIVTSLDGTVDVRGLKSKEYRVVHPGMGGSALNWPPELFRELIGRLAADSPVVITGTKADHKFLSQIVAVKELPNVKWLVDQLKVFELLDLLSQAKSVVAPSTGVLHLAASLGTPVVGIYSPRTVEHPRRWGPKGHLCAVLVPPVQDTDLINPDVMREITPDQVYTTVINLESGRAQNDVLTFPTA